MNQITKTLKTLKKEALEGADCEDKCQSWLQRTQLYRTLKVLKNGK